MALVLDQFIHYLRESRLVSAEDFTSLEKTLQESKKPPTAQDVARLLIRNGKLTEFQAVTIGQGRPQNLILGEYVLLNILGRGGMGVVFKARHRLMDRVVALKTLPQGVIKPETVQRFYREVKAAAQLSHPNIVTAYDAGEQAGIHYLVMEYVVGRNLSAVVKDKGPLPLRQAIDFVQQTARGLEFAHTHGVVHRDVKPSNLLVTKESTIKILDMGLARLNEDLAGGPEAMELTGAGQILGTVDYMSPEQAEDVHSADERSDIYSLGCTLFYLLTNRPVYGGETIIKRIFAHRDMPIPSVMEIRPDCPETLGAVIQQMLAKRREDRPRSMAEIIAALDSCLEKPGAAPPPASQLPERPGAASNWLEDLVHGEAAPAPSTKVSQAHEATIDSRAGEDIHASPLKTSGGGSTIRRAKQQLHGAAAAISTSAAPGRNSRKIIAAATLATVLAAATVTALIFKFGGSDSTAASNDSETKAKAAEVLALENAKSSVTVAAPSNSGASPVSAWSEAWTNTKAQADRLLAQRKFAQAINHYNTLAGLFQDPILQQRCNEAIRLIQAEADGAYREAEAVAAGYLQKRQFGQARTTLQTALNTFGTVPPATQRTKKLLMQIDLAEKSAAPAKKPAEPAIATDLLKRRQLDETYAKALAAVESRVAAWDFQGALSEADRIHFDAPELTARLTSRREQIRRMAELKDRMIAAINQAEPRLTKSDLALRGINGDVTTADANALATTLPSGKQESLAWPDLGPKAVSQLLQRVVRGDDAGDWLAAGLLSLAAQDTESAERFFDKARTLGADIAPYRALLAARDFAVVRELLDKHKYAESQPLLAALETRYAAVPWYAANKPEIDAAANEVKRALREKEAEVLYAQAAGLYRADELFALKPIVERLKTQYGDSAVAADPNRKPSFAEMEKAVANLGPLIRVRKDGKGDAKTIQEAVNKATLNAVIQIEELGPWAEQIVVPAEKLGLTICGKKNTLPVITVTSSPGGSPENLVVHASQLTLERLVIARAGAGGLPGTAITAEKTALSLRGVVVHGHTVAARLDAQQSVCMSGVELDGPAVARDCVFFGRVAFKGSSNLQNVLVCGGGLCGAGSQLRHCTITGLMHLPGISGTVTDCIVYSIASPSASHLIEHCDVYGENPYLNFAVPGKACFQAPPQFVDSKTFDFRLQAGSPCRKAASDGSDMGYTYTAEINPLLKVATDLRNWARGKQ